MPTFRDLLTATKAAIRETDPAGAEEARAKGAVLLDVREPDEVAQGAIPGSVQIVRGNLEAQVENRIPDKSTPIVVMCAGGVRSAFAARTLAELGYSDVISMDGGFNRWKDEGRPWATPQSLTPEQPPFTSPQLFSRYTTDTGKAKKHVIKSALAGINRAKVTGWLPKWLRFPAEAYTKRALKAGGRTAA